MVESDFYDFLNKHECKAIKRKQGDVEAWVHVDLHEVSDFTKLVKDTFGIDHLCDGGISCILTDSSLCVWIDALIEVEDYINCFPDGIEEA